MVDQMEDKIRIKLKNTNRSDEDLRFNEGMMDQMKENHRCNEE